MKVLLLLALLWLPGVALADVIFAEGMAPTAGKSITEARRDALEDALWNASSRLGITVRGISRVSEAAVTQNEIHLETAARISRYDIVGEWQEGDIYHIRIRVDAAQALCGDPDARMGAVHFPLLQPHQQLTSSLNGIEAGIPNEILHRVSLNAGTPSRRAEHRRLLEPLNGMPNPHAPEIRERVRRLAQEMEVNYLLAGVIIDIGYENIGLIRNTYLRRSEVEIYVFAGDTGELILQRRAAREARGDVLYPTPVAFGSKRFYESRYGEAFSWVLDRLSQEISGLLACPPGDRAFR